MKKALLGLLIFALPTLSALAHEEVWKMGETNLVMSNNEAKKWLLSLHCEERPCQAKKILEKISFKTLPPNSLRGGKNPGAVLCHQLKDAAVVILIDLQGNQNSFCSFSDNSKVSNSTLVIYAEKNDKK